MENTEFSKLTNFVEGFAGNMISKGVVNNVRIMTEKFGKDYCTFAQDVLCATEAMGINSKDVLTEYLFAYVRDLARFEESGIYDNGTFDEIQEKIYDNDDLMSETYLPGLFLAYGFTTLLYEKFHFFKSHFLPAIDSEMKGVEIGFGDGVYLWHILRNIDGSSVHGYDISQSAIDFTAKLLESAGIDSGRYNLEYGNLNQSLSAGDESFDWCILTEVIEHVADPIQALKEVRRIMKPGGLFFITTVIDSNHMDHITNFENTREVIDVLESNGFKVERHMEYVVAEELEGVSDRAVGLSFLCRRV